MRESGAGSVVEGALLLPLGEETVGDIVRGRL